MNSQDPRLTQIGFGGSNATASPVARVLGAIAGAAMFVVAIIVGGVLLLGFLALAAALAVAFAVRFWWWRRQMLRNARSRPTRGPGSGPSGGANGPGQAGPRSTIEGDYRVVDE
ncbi:MAG: hypothetical protein AAGM16_03615 [Pseudomonadota bacterium]